MGKRINIRRIIQSQFVNDLPIVMLGCAIAAFATDAFMVPVKNLQPLVHEQHN